MPKEQSEERNLPASAKKLRDARRKGQVPRSRDILSAAPLLAVIGFLLLGTPAILEAFQTMLGRAGDVANQEFRSALGDLWPALRDAALIGLGPMLLLVPALVVATALVAMRGIPFAMDPVTPRFEHVNPVEGFKRLFALRALVELVKTLLKTVIIVGVLVLLLAEGLRALLLAPGCGLGCEAGLFGALARPLLIATALLFLVFGLVDLGLQHWLFRREQKMSRSEFKRERKDMEGDPLIKRERRRMMRDAMAAGPLGLKRATIVIHDAERALAALRFKVGETPVPLMVSRGVGARAAELLAEARRQALPCCEDAALAADLVKRIQPGRFVPEDSYRPVARAIATTRAG